MKTAFNKLIIQHPTDPELTLIPGKIEHYRKLKEDYLINPAMKTKS